MYEMPRESHFEEYKKKKSKTGGVEMLRASQQLEGYDLKKIPASDRRQQFVFEPDAEENYENDFERDPSDPISENPTIHPITSLPTKPNFSKRPELAD